MLMAIGLFGSKYCVCQYSICLFLCIIALSILMELLYEVFEFTWLASLATAFDNK